MLTFEHLAVLGRKHLDELRGELFLAVEDPSRAFALGVQWHPEVDEASGKRTGILVEYDRTSKIFTTPADQRTEDYVTGRFG